MDGVKFGKVGKSENSQTGESRKNQDEEKLCKSIITGQARHNREKHMTLAHEEEVQHVLCIDDVTSKELPWHGVRKDHENDFFFLRDFAECLRNSANVEAIAQYQVTPVDTKWIDTNKAFEESPCKSDRELLHESSKVTIG